MTYVLQYQAHVDDLTSLAGSLEAVSWFTTFAHEAPQAPVLLAEGFFAADLHSAGAEPADVSWFTTFAHEAPLERELPPLGFFAADLHGAGAEPGDVSWFTTFAHEAPVERELPPLGFFAGDIDSGSALEWLRLGLPFLYTAAAWGSSLGVYLEAFCLAQSGTVRVRLYDVSAATDIPASWTSTASTSLTRIRSADLAALLTDGNIYRLEFGTSVAAPGQILGGKLVIGS